MITHLGDAILSPADLSEGQSVLRVRRLNDAIGRLRLALDGIEPWLVEWLKLEHYRLATIYVGAQMAQNAPPGEPLAKGSKQSLVMSFNLTSNDTASRLLEYELSDRVQATVHEWSITARAFRDDPVKV